LLCTSSNLFLLGSSIRQAVIQFSTDSWRFIFFVTGCGILIGFGLEGGVSFEIVLREEDLGEGDSVIQGLDLMKLR